MKNTWFGSRCALALALLWMMLSLPAAGQDPAGAAPDKPEKPSRKSKKSSDKVEKPKDKKVASAPKDLITKGRKAYNDLQFKESADNYQKYIELYPDGPDRDEAGFFYGQCLYLLHRFNEAEATLAKEMKRNKTYPDQILYFRGEIAAAIRDYSQGVVYFERVLSEYPKSPVADKAQARRADLLYLMANQYYDQGAHSLALQNYIQIKNARTELVPLIQYHVGMAYARMKDLDNAAKVLIELSKSPASPDGDDAARLAQYRLARLYEDADKFPEAEIIFKSLVEKSPGHYLEPLAREGLARVLARQGRVEEAAAFWKSQGGSNKLVERSGQFSSALMNYVHGEYGDAAKKWGAMLAVANDPELQWKSQVWLARTYYADGRYPQAVKTWKELFDNRDQPPDFMRVEYARALLNQDPRAAAKIMSAVTDMDTDDKMGVKALTQLAAGDPGADAAVDSYLSRHGSGAWVGELTLLRARARLVKGNVTGAESDLKTAMLQHPDPEKRLAAALELSQLYRREGRPDSAVEAISSAGQSARQVLSPEGKLSRENAEVAYSRGDYARGTELYDALCGGGEKGVTCSPDDLFRLFFGYYKMKQYDPADRALTQLAATGSNGAFQAGFWRGMMLFVKGDANEAFTVLRGLSPSNNMDLGLQAWLIAQLQSKGGAAGEAARTLSRMDELAPEFAYYGRGELMAQALEGGDFTQYLADLPDPAQSDEENLSQTALISILRTKAMAHAEESELAAINRLLQVETTNEDIAAEGNLLVARAGLYGQNREAAVARLEEILYRNPGSRVEAEVRLYRGEEAYVRKDYEAALAWIGELMPEEVPEELRFRMLYLQGISYKQLGNYKAARQPLLLIIQDHYDFDASAAEWNDIGIGLYLAQEYASSVMALDLAIAKADTRDLQAEIYYWKGMSEYGAGNLDSALGFFLKVAHDYRDQGMWATTAEYWAAGVYADKGDNDKALELYKKVLGASRGDRARVEKVNEKIVEIQKRKLGKTSDDTKGNFWDRLKKDDEPKPEKTDKTDKTDKKDAPK